MVSSAGSRPSSTATPMSALASPTTSSRGAHGLPSPASPPTLISYGQRHVKARIDGDVPLDEVLKQLVGSPQLGISEPAALFALREQVTDELVTPVNFHAKLLAGSSFKLVSSPTIEASEMIEKLAMRSDEKQLKMATFSLKSYLREPPFTSEFIRRGGVKELIKVVEVATGNTLAYALASLQSLMDLDNDGWDQLDDQLIAKLVIIVSQQSLTNIVRPATSILRNVVSSNAHAPQHQQASTSQSTRSSSQSGFLRVWPAIRHGNFLKAVVESLTAGDKLLVQASLELLNALLQPAIELEVDDFLEAIDSLDPQASVARLADSSPPDDLVPAIIAYQANLVRQCAADRRPVDVKRSHHLRLLDEIAQHAPLSTLGIDAADLDAAFGEMGLLALKAFVAFARRWNDLSKILTDRAVKPENKRCDITRASNHVLEAIADHLNFMAGELTAGGVDPVILSWQRVHALAIKMFFRFWSESGATTTEIDYDRVAELVRSQVRVALSTREGATGWAEVESVLVSTDYKTVRERMSREAETEEDLLTKAPVRNLRHRLYSEAFDFMRAQRLRCLTEGAWFLHSLPPTTGKRNTGPRLWRFYRLAANQKHLHYTEASVRSPVRGGLEELPERIDLSLVTDIVPHPAAKTVQRISGPTSPTSMLAGSGGSFSMMSGEVCVAELQAPDQHIYAEWLDGLSLLKPNGHIQTQETAELVQILTEIGVRIKLLDLEGERVELPSSVPVLGVPTSEDFFYDAI